MWKKTMITFLMSPAGIQPGHEGIWGGVGTKIQKVVSLFM